ncbi:hypothetical protein [Actinoplanes solisilvae]|uniref:hypothetical protein n=1 Tax=Actinoplanes solisilvae TaxID=2486853 RepID=UPI000FD9B974|nr:hypothetical protein [Actinoplanes solisilvae]
MARTGDVDATGTTEAGAPHYSGAVYGSLLAASVVVGAASGGHGELEFRPIKLAALLVVTGSVFWLTHAYAALAGERLRHRAPDPREIRHVLRHEWPLLQAALPPAVAAVVLGLLGASDTAAAWAALIVAIVAQVGWATVTTVRAGATTRLVALTVLVNLVLGLIIVLLKSALHH